VIAHLRSYLPDEEAVLAVLRSHNVQLGELVHRQMQDHYEEHATEYEVSYRGSTHTLESPTYEVPANVAVRDVHTPVDDPQAIRRMLFGGFRRSLYPVQKFDSDPERAFAALLEDDAQPLKWLKPAARQFHIYFHHDGSHLYEPDFAVETDSAKYLIETKRASQIQDREVLAKADAAARWCAYATEYERQNSGKPWRYVLIPHDRIAANQTLAGLVTTYTRVARIAEPAGA
jgi:type III restriction enzyme